MSENNNVDQSRNLASKIGIYHTICPRSNDPFFIVTYYIKWATTSWTHSSKADINARSIVFVYSCYKVIKLVDIKRWINFDQNKYTENILSMSFNNKVLQNTTCL